MYLAGEDYYLFTYSALIILRALKCKDGKYFKDYRKLPFLIEILNDENLVFILKLRESVEDLNSPVERTGKKVLNPVDKDYFFRSYSNGIARRSEILKILFTLEKLNYISLKRGDKDLEIDVSLNSSAIPRDFFNTKIFSRELENMEKIKSIIKRLGSLTLVTMIDRIYEKNGIKTWGI
ncbi:MAG: hypothetical protein HY254_13445 [Burkholderiales bacterium]|nr:hypothetical protein [Burkholderiales bacterium]